MALIDAVIGMIAESFALAPDSRLARNESISEDLSGMGGDGLFEVVVEVLVVAIDVCLSLSNEDLSNSACSSVGTEELSLV